jgi:site-specific recombinase XerC
MRASFYGIAGRFRHAAPQLLRSLRAENAAPRTIEAYTLAVGQLGEHLAGSPADLPTTNDLRREHAEDFLNALSEQGLAAATLNTRTGQSRVHGMPATSGGGEPGLHGRRRTVEAARGAVG